MQFPCADALSYAHLCEGRIDVVIQCMNKIWDIHPVIPISAGGISTTWDNLSMQLLKRQEVFQQLGIIETPNMQEIF